MPLKPSDRNIFKADNTLEMLESILDSMGVGVFVCDKEGYMLYSNESSAKIIGYKFLAIPFEERVKLIGNFLVDGVTPFPADELPIARAIRGIETDDVEYIVKNPRRPNGVRVSVSGRPLKDRNDNIIGGVLVQRDVTEQRREEEEREHLKDQLQRAQKLESLGLMVGGVAHDYNNLLMGILGNVDLLAAEAGNSSLNRDRLDQVKTAATRLAELTKQLLAFAGRKTTFVERIDLASLVEEMTGLAAPTLPPQLELVLEVMPGLPPISADAVQLRQVVTNLITNAADAIGKNSGKITVKVGLRTITEAQLKDLYIRNALRTGPAIYLSVEDNGCGMTSQTLSRIFEPFFTTKPHGHGLGLASTIGILKRHGCGLEVKSEVGHGSKFTVLFTPAEELKRADESAKTEQKPNHIRVLFVDDDPLVTEVSSAMLGSLGCLTTVALGGKEALEIVNRGLDEYQLAIIDLNMPDIGGLHIMHKIRERYPELPIVVSSGDADAGVNISASFSKTLFLPKPYTLTELKSVIGALGII